MSLSTGADSRDLFAGLLGALYNGAWGALAALNRPLAFFGAERWREKSGFYAARQVGSHCWIHACSVGEVRIALGFIHEIRQRCPELCFTLSTVTGEGLAAARAGLRGPQDAAVYFPFDSRRIMARAFDRLNPDFVVLSEVELWPNHLREAAARGIPVFVINGRLTEDDEESYRRAGLFMQRAFAVLDLVCARGPAEAGRFERLGAGDVVVVGDMKYETLDWDKTIAASRETSVLLAASTHAGEEEILLRVLGRLRNNLPALQLVIVPRHPRRAAGIVRMAVRQGFSADLFSEQKAKSDVVVVDEIGCLGDWYARATVCFVGKSLAARGGQNFLEAAAAGCPVVTGPYIGNFADAAERFLAKKAMTIVPDARALESGLARLLSDTAERERMSEAARQIASEGSGATKRTVDLILGRLGS